MKNDLRFALRQIARAPLFSTVIIVVMALGIGLNSVLFTIVHLYMGLPAPGIARDPKLATIWATHVVRDKPGDRPTSLSYPDVADLRQLTGVFRDVAAWDGDNIAVDFGDGPEPAIGFYTTDNFFRVLGVKPALGTTFPETGERSTAPIAVIGHSTWETRFGSAPDVIGRTIKVDGTPVTIVGVAPRHFTGIKLTDEGTVRMWMPLGARAVIDPGSGDHLRSRSEMSLDVIVRLASGVDRADVAQRTSVLASRITQSNPDTHGGLRIEADPMRGGGQRNQGDTTELMIGAVLIGSLVLAVTCTNVSALLLGRAVSRRREIGVRLSIGATRARVIRQLLTECLVLSLAGAAFGLSIYVGAVKVLYATVPELPYGLEPERGTFLFATFFAVGMTLVFGLAPALHASRENIAEVIKDGGGHQVKRSRLQASFVIAQLACSQPFLIVTALMMASIRREAFAAASAAPADVVTIVVDAYTRIGASVLGPTGDSLALEWNAKVAAMRADVASLPGVRTAAVSNYSGDGSSFEAAGSAPADRPRGISQFFVSRDYFSTLGIPLVRGRVVDRDDDHPGVAVAVLNEEAARVLFPGEDPIGKRLVRRNRFVAGAQPTVLEVIGVVGTASYSPPLPKPFVYVPYATLERFAYGPELVVRTTGPARGFVPAIRGAIRLIDPVMPLTSITTLAEKSAKRRAEGVQEAVGALAVGLAALLLASIGLYGIISFAVAQRTKEIGIRMALGATRRDVVRHFFNGGMRVTLIGLAIGAPIALAGIQLIEAGLLKMPSDSWISVVGVSTVLLCIAGVASWLPARRAASVDPLNALRAE